MLFCAISGFLTGIVFMFPSINPLAFISLIPFLKILETEKNSFKSGFLYGFFLNISASFFLLSMHPLDFLGIYGIRSFIIVFFAYLGICILEGILWGTVCFIYKKHIKIIWFFPLVYSVGEFLFSLGPLGYTFSDLYLVFFKNTAFIQSAALFSSYFITFVIVFINLLIYKAYAEKTVYIFVALSVFLANISYGIITLKADSTTTLPKENITLVQGNITSHEKWKNTNMYSILRAYKELTEKAISEENSKIFIWPETIVPVPIDKDHNIYGEFKDFAKENKITLVTGAFTKEKDKIFNSILVFDENGNVSGEVYKKRHLIPVSEGNIQKGTEPVTANTPAGKIGFLVCIDSAYPHLSYETVRNNPDFLVVVSNDSWFENSHGISVHNAHSIFRAIESKKYLLRCANTGITAIISPKGKIISSLSEGEKGYITYEK